MSKTKEDLVNQPSIFNDSGEISRALLPDTTINQKLRLLDYGSVRHFYPGEINLLERLRESPVVFFCTKDKKQYLLAYQYEGDTKDAFSVFEVGYTDSLNGASMCNVTSENSFRTESGLILGMPLHTLIALKGYNFNLPVHDSVLIYRIDSTAQFLSRYKMPGYFLECQIRNGHVSQFKFGFDYP